MALAASVFQPLSLANCYFNSSSTPKATPYSFLSITSKPLKYLPLFSCYSSSCSKRLPSWRPSLTASVAQTSDWAPRQDEDKDAGFDWEQQQQEEEEEEEAAEEEEEEVAEGVEAGLSEWEGEGEEFAESSDEESAGDGEDLLESGDEDSYLPPPEEAKLFVGNLPYDVESGDLAALFEQAGVVESAEVEFHIPKFLRNY